MENKINKIVEILKSKDNGEKKSISIFDLNDNCLCTVGTPNLTENDAANLRQCITGSWDGPVKMKIGKYSYLCLKVSSIILGKGNFNTHADSETTAKSIVGGAKLKQEKLQVNKKQQLKVNKKEENLMLSAALVDELTVVLTGRRVDEESLVEQIKEISDILSEQNL